MGDVIYLPSAMRGDRPLNQQRGLTLNEVERLEAIRDNVCLLYTSPSPRDS